MPSHFRRFRRALDRRVASIGSCFNGTDNKDQTFAYFQAVALSFSDLKIETSLGMKT